MKNEINIRQSINTDTIEEDFKNFTDSDAPLIENTGIERNGGVTNIYENKETYGTPGDFVITSDNKVLSLTTSTTNNYKVVKIDDNVIGQVSSYGLATDLTIKDADDVFLIQDGYVTCSIADSTITVNKYNLSQELQGTRSIVFANLSPVMQLFTSISFVKYNGMQFTDSLEFALRLGDQVVIIQESNTSISVTTAIQSTAVLGGNAVYASIVYNGQLIVAGAGGRLGSYDGKNWKNYDGSGLGTGIYQDGSAGAVIGTNNIRSLAVFGNSLAVGGVGGRVGSFDGSAWIVYTSATGIASSTVVSTDTVSCMTTYKGFLIVCGSTGKLGSYNGITWTTYSSTATGAVCDNNTLLAGAINSCCIFTDSNGDDTLVVAGESGKLASFKIQLNQGGLTWSYTTNPAPAGGWRDISYGNGVWVAVAGTTSTTAGIARSTDNGATWSFVTTTAPAAAWYKVSYGNGVFLAICMAQSTTAALARSTNGGASWTFITTPAGIGHLSSVKYGNGVWILTTTGYSTTSSVLRSTDNGATWSFATTSTTVGGWYDCAYNSITNTWMMVAEDPDHTTNVVSKSTDSGITWTNVSTSPADYFSAIVSYNGYFFIWFNDGGTSSIYRSSNDGATWTNLVPPATDGITGITYNNGTYIAVNRSTSTTNGIFRSTDNGSTWTPITISAPASGWNCCSYGNDTFIAAAGSTSTTAAISRSLDKKIDKHIYTTTSTSSYPTNNATVIGANNINALAIKSNVSSGLGVSWTTSITPTLQTDAFWYKVSYGNGVWLAIVEQGDSGFDNTKALARSTDNGATWSYVVTPDNSNMGGWSSVSYGNGVWIMVARAFDTTYAKTHSIARSTDNGLTWSIIQTATEAGGLWLNVQYSNNVWIAQAYSKSTSSSIARSTDNGLTWTFVTTPTTTAVGWFSLSYGNGIWMCCAAGFFTSPSASDTLMRSTDNGLTWNLVNSFAVTYGWQSIAYGNGVWLATANNVASSTQSVIKSTDNGLTWSYITTPTGINLYYDVVYYNGVWILTGKSANTGVFRSTDNANTWTVINTVGSYSISFGVNTFIKASGTEIDRSLGTALNSLIVAGGTSTSLVGSFVSDGTWYNYNSGSTAAGAFCDNGTLINAAVTSMILYKDSIVVAGAGKLACFYNDNTKHVYNSGLALSNNGTIIGANTINTLASYNDLLFVGGTSGLVNSMNSAGAFSTFYSSGSTYVSNLLEGFNTLNYLYAYRYENGIYLLNLVGNTLSKSYTLNNATKQISIVTASNVLLQVSNGKSRHICTAENTTARPIYTGTELQPSGLIGYTDFITFSNTIVYPTCTNTISSILQSNASWGYSDITFKTTASATNILNYVSQFQRDVSGLYKTYQSNSDTLVNAYGKLTNNFGVKPSVPFEFRINMINGQPSYFSVALLDSVTTDAMGVILTNVGAINDLYQPEIRTDDTLLYQDDMNNFRIKIVSTVPMKPIQKIFDSAYKINTISPLNIIDLNTNSLDVGSLDFNNRMLFTSSAVPTVSTKIASFIQGTYSNSIDTGDKLVTIMSPTASNIELIGYRIPVVSTNTSKYSIDTYFADIYSFSTINNGLELVLPDKVNTVYVASTFLPMPIGSYYSNQTVQGENITLFLKPEYDGYSIGNDIVGKFDVFTLFGQTYLFDGLKIYLATVDNVTGIFASKDLVCSAVGLKLVATTPTAVYFVSSFDNSLYTFDGGRSLSKYKRFNSMSKITSGIYSTVDNELLFETSDSFIWVRDGIITENMKAVDQTNLSFYDTKKGIVMGNKVSNWRYSYFEEVGSTVVPLVLQTPYFGFNLDTKSILSNWVITIYNEKKDVINVTGTSYVIDEDIERTQIVNWTINPVDYNDGGYVRIRIQPQNQRSLGTSLKLECNNKILIVSILPEFSEGETAVVAASRSV